MSLHDFPKSPKFEDYKERFKNHYKMERRPDGVILVQAHTLGGSVIARPTGRKPATAELTIQCNAVPDSLSAYGRHCRLHTT